MEQLSSNLFEAEVAPTRIGLGIGLLEFMLFTFFGKWGKEEGTHHS